MTIVLSSEASRQLTDLFSYLEEEWSLIVRRKFQKKLDRSLKVIKLSPNAFPASIIFPECRRCIVTKQTSIIYKIQENTIFIVAVFDNRREV